MPQRLLVSVLTAAILSLMIVSPASAATEQYGCTFTVPKPTITNGKAGFTIRMSCPNSPRGTFRNRQMVVDLMGDDVSRDDVIKWSVKNTWTNRSYTWTYAGWPCNEDSGTDEIYLRIHVEADQYGAFGGWKKGSWINGPATSGTCS